MLTPMSQQTQPARPVHPDDLFALDAVLEQDERDAARTVRAFCDDQLRPHAARWYVEGALPARDLAKALGGLGLLGMHLDGYGCPGTSAAMYGVACRELEAVDAGVRSLVSVQGSLTMTALHRYGSEEHKQEWLPAMATGEAVGCFGLTEPDAGSDPGSMRSTARQQPGGDWVLDGTKMWITNAPVADVAVVWARADTGSGERPRVHGFVVPLRTGGVGVTEVPRKLSMRASVTGEITLDGVRLPADAVLPGAQGLRGPLACLTEARFGIVWGTTGSLRDSLEVAVDYARERVQFGKPIGSFQLTQAKLADAAARYTTAFLLALHLARLKDGRVPGAQATPELVSLAKMDNARAALDVARSMRSILGGSGITADYSPMRHAANLETVITYEGTQEVHQLVVGKALTGLDAFGG